MRAMPYLYLYNTNSVCVCMCLSSIGGQTAGPIMTKFGTYMRIDLGMVPTKKKWSHVWSGRVGSLGPFFEAGTWLAGSEQSEPWHGAVSQAA